MLGRGSRVDGKVEVSFVLMHLSYENKIMLLEVLKMRKNQADFEGQISIIYFLFHLILSFQSIDLAQISLSTNS